MCIDVGKVGEEKELGNLPDNAMGQGDVSLMHYRKNIDQIIF